MKHPEWNKASGGCQRVTLARYHPDSDTFAAPASSPVLERPQPIVTSECIMPGITQPGRKRGYWGLRVRRLGGVGRSVWSYSSAAGYSPECCGSGRLAGAF